MTNNWLVWGMFRVWAFCIVGGLILLALLFTNSVHADGGAPNLAYVTGTPHGVSVIDVRQRRVTTTLNVPGNPHMVLLSQDGQFLFVTEPQQGRVAVLVARTGRMVCDASLPGHPSLLAFDLNTNLLYVAGNDGPTVTALNPTTCQTKLSIQTNGGVSALAVVILSSGISGSAGDQLWVASKTLMGYDDLSGQQFANIPLAGEPQNLSIPPGETLYVTTRQGEIDAVDLSSRNVEPLVTGGSYGPMDYDAVTDEVYVPDRAHQQLVVLAPVILGSPLPTQPERTIHLDAMPESVAITSDGQFAFVALSNGNVAMLDLPGRQIITTIFVGGTPQFIITGLYPPLTDPIVPQSSQVRTYEVVIIVAVAAFLAIIVLLLWFLLLKRRVKRA